MQEFITRVNKNRRLVVLTARSICFGLATTSIFCLVHRLPSFTYLSLGSWLDSFSRAFFPFASGLSIWWSQPSDNSRGGGIALAEFTRYIGDVAILATSAIYATYLMASRLGFHGGIEVLIFVMWFAVNPLAWLVSVVDGALSIFGKELRAQDAFVVWAVPIVTLFLLCGADYGVLTGRWWTDPWTRDRFVAAIGRELGGSVDRSRVEHWLNQRGFAVVGEDHLGPKKKVFEDGIEEHHWTDSRNVHNDNHQGLTWIFGRKYPVAEGFPCNYGIDCWFGFDRNHRLVDWHVADTWTCL